MDDKIVKTIVEAEKQAEEMVNRAIESARGITSSANDKAEQIRENAALELKECQKKRAEKAANQSDARYNEKLKEGKSETDLKYKAVKIDKAAAFIVSELEKS